MQDDEQLMGRRTWLAGLGAAAAAGLVFDPVAALAKPVAARRLKMFNTHTKEAIDVTYWRGGRYDAKSLKKLNAFLRDHYANQIAKIDPRLFDLLHVVQSSLKSTEPFQVISGYRSPATNAALRAESDNVAFHSYHMKGMAVDVALPDRKVVSLARCATDLRCGGVGTYSSSGFVHLDVGPVRQWRA